MALFYAEEPWGPWRDNVHAALIASTIRNVFRKKGTRAVDWNDFMLVNKAEHKRGKLASFVGWMRSMARKKKEDVPSQT